MDSQQLQSMVAAAVQAALAAERARGAAPNPWAVAAPVVTKEQFRAEVLSALASGYPMRMAELGARVSRPTPILGVPAALREQLIAFCPEVKFLPGPGGGCAYLPKPPAWAAGGGAAAPAKLAWCEDKEWAAAFEAPAPPPVKPASVAPPAKAVPSYEPPDLREALSTVMNYRSSRVSKYQLVWEMVRETWERDPDGFTIVGGLHTTVDGSRTYFSVKYRRPDEESESKTWGFQMHVYGAVRFNSFRHLAVDVFYYQEKYEDAWKHNPTPPASSVSEA